VTFAGITHGMALSRVREFVQSERIQASTIAVLPQPPSAAQWAGMIATPNGVFRIQFSTFGDDPAKIQFFASSQSNRYIEDARAMRDVQTYLWFARFPIFRYFERDGQHVVQISDLSFYGAGRTRTDAPAEAPPNFTREVVFSDDGRVVSDGWIRLNQN
jgi:hypothetical protein